MPTMSNKPKIRVKVSDVERLAKLQCTPREVAAFLGIRVGTFRKLLEEDPDIKRGWERGKQMGLISLRRKQMRLAGSNATMGVFLGKNYLGQKDTVTNEHTGPDGGPMELDLGKLPKSERDDLRQLLTRATRSRGGSS